MARHEQLERLVWAAAFAARFESERAFAQGHGYSIANVEGFTAAECADVAVEKLRQALSGPDARFLMPVKEAWEETPAEEAERRGPLGDGFVGAMPDVPITPKEAERLEAARRWVNREADGVRSSLQRLSFDEAVVYNLQTAWDTTEDDEQILIDRGAMSAAMHELQERDAETEGTGR